MTALYLVFRVGAAEYLMPASDVLQIESYGGATGVPGAAAYVAGIVQVRGKVVPLVDLRARFGLGPAPPTLDTRIVVGERDQRPVGLVVDGAREVLKLDPAQLEPPPRLVAGEAQGFVKAVARVDKRLLMLIDFERVIGKDVLDGEERRA